MKHAKTNIKKLVKNTFEKHSVSRITADSLKDIIKSEGYIVSDFSTLTPVNQSERFMDGLGIAHYAEYYDSFTYSDRTIRIVFIRKDVSDEEYLFLLSLELGKILTHTDSIGNIIGLGVRDTGTAYEFAYHVKDISRHGVVYNMLKYYTAGSVAGISAVIASVATAVGSLLSGQAADGFINENIYEDIDVISALAQEIPEGSYEINVDNGLTVTIPDENAAVSGDNVISDFIISEDTRIYYATKSGKKYHIAGCSYIKGKETVSLTHADISGGSYEPCSRCFK